MQQSKTIPQESLSFGQASVAASVILVFLALTVPMVGLLMIPVMVLTTVARAVRDMASEGGLLKKRWLATPRTVPAGASMFRAMRRRPGITA